MFYTEKKVLVTGGTGFVGTHFVEELLRQGADVRITVHQRPPIVKDSRIELVYADLTKPEECCAACHDVEYVFHCAGAVSAAAVTNSNPMSAIVTNLTLTTQMLQAAWMENVERFLVFSSSTGYPEADHPIKEEEMWNGQPYPVYFGYGWMRRYLELISEFVAEKSSMRIALARPTAVYGRWDNFDPVTSHVIPALIRRAVEKQDPFVVWGTGDEVRDFLHITDLVQGCLLLTEKHAVCDPVNLGYGEAVTIKEILKTILTAADHDEAEVIFDNTKPGTIPFRMIDTSKARNLLGFERQVSLDMGITDTVRWYAHECEQKTCD
jgi:GDP-L-fucose synthase